MLYVTYIPTFGKQSQAWWQNYNAIQRPLGAAAGEGFDNRPDASIADKRNEGVRKAIEANAKVLFFIGDDVHCPAETFQMMLRRWREGAKAVTGVYWTKSMVPEPYIWKGYMDGAFYDWKAGEYFPIDWAGCDCLMLDVEMLKQMPQPCFSLEYTMDKSDARKWNPGLNTEDLYFYSKLKDMGVQLMCDSSIQCWHEDRNTGQLYGLRDGMPQKVSDPVTIKGKLIADIGCGNTVNPLYQDNTLIRYDQDPNCKPDFICNALNIPEKAETFDIVLASHVLEHLQLSDIEKALKEWTRILKIGGELVVKVPNLQYAAKVIAEDNVYTNDSRWPYPYELLMVYGNQEGEGQFHKTGFTPKIFEGFVNKALNGLAEYKIEGTGIDARTQVATELTLTAKRIYKEEVVRRVADSFVMPVIKVETPAEISNGHDKEKIDNLIPA